MATPLRLGVLPSAAARLGAEPEDEGTPDTPAAPARWILSRSLLFESKHESEEADVQGSVEEAEEASTAAEQAELVAAEQAELAEAELASNSFKAVVQDA